MAVSIFGFNLMMAVCLLIQMSGVVESTGTLELLMNNFQNPSGRLWDDSCCDTWCIGQCDTIFHFGLDKPSGNNNFQSNFYLTKVTGTYENKDNVNFNDNMNGVNNPIIWNFNSWPGTVLFKVEIEDDDGRLSKRDHLDRMVYTLTLTPARSKSSVSGTPIIISGQRSKRKTTLSFTYKLYCDEKFYGSTCSVYCVAEDSDAYGHYTCDHSTGAKICRPGWKGTDCKTK